MKKTIILVSLSLLLATPAMAGVGGFNYIGSVGVSKEFEKYRGQKIDSVGLCSFHMLDVQPLPWMAIGLGFGFERYSTDLTSDGSISTDFVMLAGRLLPVSLKDGQTFTPYLVGGIGAHVHALTPDWAGAKGHLLAGVGGRFDLDKKAGGSAINVELVATGRTPMTAEFRVGYSVAFGGKKGPSTGAAVAAKPASGVPEIVTAIQAASTDKAGQYTVKPNDTLWTIACRKTVYADCELYTVLVASNKDILKSPADVKPGVVLKVPGNLTEQYKAKARALAWTDTYLPWRGTKVTKEKYDAWKAGRTGSTGSPQAGAAPAPAPAKPVAKPSGTYKTEDWYTIQPNDTLWAVSCRKAAFGDCELYPLLVDANKDVLKSPADIRAGVLIKIPKDLSEADKQAAREKAWSDAYVPWRGANVTKEKYDAWKNMKSTGMKAPTPGVPSK